MQTDAHQANKKKHPISKDEISLLEIVFAYKIRTYLNFNVRTIGLSMVLTLFTCIKRKFGFFLRLKRINKLLH